MPRDWAAEEIYSDIDPIAKLDVRISFPSAKLAPHSPLKSTRINRLVHARKLSSLEQDMILNSRRRPIKSIHRQFIWTRVHTQSLATDTRRATTKKHFKTKKIHVFLLFQFTPQNGTYTLSRSSQPATGKTRNRIRFLSYLFRRIFFFFLFAVRCFVSFHLRIIIVQEIVSEYIYLWLFAELIKFDPICPEVKLMICSCNTQPVVVCLTAF